MNTSHLVRRPPSGTAATSDHVPEIDCLKGFAILLVIGIHAKLGVGTLIQQHLVNRAVPVFFVLFAVTAELWWQRTARMDRRDRLRDWYGARLRRLCVPFWSMAAVWWLVVLATGKAGALHVGPAQMLATFLGYAPWIGTSWFVTVILQLVLLYPLLRWAFERVGPWVALPATWALCLVANLYMLPLIHLATRWLGRDTGFYYAWIFSPRTFWNVAAGYFIARWWSGRPPRLATWVAALVTSVGIIVIENLRPVPGVPWLKPVREQTYLYLNDIPLTVFLLGSFSALSRFPRMTRALAWCGVSSWGIYLGHTLVHELLHSVANVAPEMGSPSERFSYAILLLVSGTSLTVLGTRIRRAELATSDGPSST